VIVSRICETENGNFEDPEAETDNRNGEEREIAKSESRLETQEESNSINITNKMILYCHMNE
jgi:hypothetical protein